MRYDVLLSIVFELLEKRRVTAGELADKHKLSPRTLYRYIEKLSPFLPLHVLRGRRGGVYLSDDYRLPVGFFTEQEYQSLLDSLRLAYERFGEERFLLALRKLSVAKRQAPPSPLHAENGEILFLPSPEEGVVAETLRQMQTAIRQKRVLRLLEEKSRVRFVEPHSLVLSGNAWSLYGFCHEERKFLLLPLKDMRGVLLTEETFHPRALEEVRFLSRI